MPKTVPMNYQYCIMGIVCIYVGYLLTKLAIDERKTFKLWATILKFIGALIIYCVGILNIWNCIGKEFAILSMIIIGILTYKAITGY